MTVRPQPPSETILSCQRSTAKGEFVTKEGERSKSAKSLLVFGLYLAVLGVILVASPNFLLALFLIPATQEVWIRVVGVVVLILSFYDIQAARGNVVPFFKWSVYARTPVVLFFTAFVLLRLVQPPLILFGLIDLAGATWTWFALRSEYPKPG
jgi:hypothetical protein